MIDEKLQLVPFENFTDPCTHHDITDAANLSATLCEFGGLPNENEEAESNKRRRDALCEFGGLQEEIEEVAESNKRRRDALCEFRGLPEQNEKVAESNERQRDEEVNETRCEEVDDPRGLPEVNEKVAESNKMKRDEEVNDPQYEEVNEPRCEEVDDPRGLPDENDPQYEKVNDPHCEEADDPRCEEVDDPRGLPEENEKVAESTKRQRDEEVNDPRGLPEENEKEAQSTKRQRDEVNDPQGLPEENEKVAESTKRQRDEEVNDPGCEEVNDPRGLPEENEKVAESTKRPRDEEVNDPLFEEVDDEVDDPQYELFLNSLEIHEKSYRFQFEENGLTVFVKYEEYASSADECDVEPAGRLRSPMMQKNEPTNQSPNIENQSSQSSPAKATGKLASRHLRNEIPSEDEMNEKSSTNRAELDTSNSDLINYFKEFENNQYALTYDDFGIDNEQEDHENEEIEKTESEDEKNEESSINIKEWDLDYCDFIGGLEVVGDSYVLTYGGFKIEYEQNDHMKEELKKTVTKKDKKEIPAINKCVLDPDYCVFMECYEVVGNNYVLKYGGRIVAYELTDEKNELKEDEHEDSFGSVESIDTKSFQEDRENQKLSMLPQDAENMGVKEYPGGYSSDVEILESSSSEGGNLNDDSMMNECSTPDLKDIQKFRRKAIRILQKPYNQNEFHKLREDIQQRKLETRNLDLRYGREIAYSAGKEGKSYLDHYPVFRRKLNQFQGDKFKCLNLLRGFFFWLQQPDPPFRPWEDEECLAVVPEAAKTCHKGFRG